MGLTYSFEFRAPADTPSHALESFLREVQALAGSLGFAPTMVLNVPFDTPERREFSRRFGGRMRGVAGGAGNPVTPEHGVVLVITGENGLETCFGFLRYPARMSGDDDDGNATRSWVFRDWIKSPDPRLRRIVAMFRDAGYLAAERDDFAA